MTFYGSAALSEVRPPEKKSYRVLGFGTNMRFSRGVPFGAANSSDFVHTEGYGQLQRSPSREDGDVCTDLTKSHSV